MIFPSSISDTINVNANWSIINPSSINNQVFHIDAQDTNADSNYSNEPANNSQIDIIEDKFNSHSWSQDESTKMPVYKTWAINSKPALLFDWSNDIINIEDSEDINTWTWYSEKTIALVIKTWNDISNLQSIYEQWVEDKWYSIQIEWWKMYAWVWNDLDWLSPNQHKIIDLWNIDTNEVYRVLITHDTSISAYINWSLASSLTTVGTQTNHWNCDFDMSYECIFYSTWWTIGIWAVKNDSLKLSDSSDINSFEWNHFSWYIWEIISWNKKLTTTEIEWIDNYFIDRWNIDKDDPNITSIFPWENRLIPTWNFNIEIEYNDTWVWINNNSAIIKLYKWNSSSWGNDISNSWINGSWEIITSTWAKYQTNNLTYWKYKIDFSIDDLNWNSSSTWSIFYIDEPEFLISTWSINIWTLEAGNSEFSDEITITVKTVWAPFRILLNKNQNLEISWDSINDWDWSKGFWYDKETYSNTISKINNDEIITNQTWSLNTSWEKNTYEYKIKIWALVEDLQSWWIYSWNLDFNINLEY